MVNIHNVVKGVSTYSGRDACIRVTCYFTLFLYGILHDIEPDKHVHSQSHVSPLRALFVDYLVYYLVAIESLPSLALGMRLLSKQFATARLVARFFDNIPALFNFFRHLNTQLRDTSDTNKKDSTSKKKTHPYIRWLTSVNLLFWVLYNPCEHIGWLAELKIIKADDQLWYFYTNVAWAGGLFTSVLLNLRVVYMYYTQEASKAKREDDPTYDSSLLITQQQMQQAALIAFRDFLDWCIAIHFMPEGFLWSSRLYHYQVGLIGTVSSLCRVHTYIINKQE